MITRLDRSGRGTALWAEEITKRNANATREGRNMRVLLLRISVLSRRNCSWGAGTAEIEFRPPLGERRERDIKKAALEHEQEGYRQVLPMHEGEPNEIAKVNGKGQFGQRKHGLQWLVFAGPPRL